jgi:hypothetical protein
MMEINKEIKDFVQEDYVQWLNTRCKYTPAIPVGILASMQPSKSGPDRDYANCPLCSAFNTALMLQRELLGAEHYRAFILVYFGKDATRYYRSVDIEIVNVKSHADYLSVSNQAIYDMAHKFVLTAYNSAVGNLDFNSKMQGMMLNERFEFSS